MTVAVVLLLTGCGSTGDPAAPSSQTTVITTASAHVSRDNLLVTVTGLGDPRVMTLACMPPGGNHPTPRLACSALKDYLENATAPPAHPTRCPPPDTAHPHMNVPRVTVSGTYAGAPVDIDISETDCGDWGALLALTAPPNAG